MPRGRVLNGSLKKLFNQIYMSEPCMVGRGWDGRIGKKEGGWCR